MISEPFGFKARREVEALGLGSLPVLVLPHPIGQLPNDEMRAIADQSFAEVEFVLIAPALKVAETYTDSTKPRSFPPRS